MTEAVISLPVLLLLFLATYYFHGAYRAKLRSMRMAASATWAIVNEDACRENGATDEPNETEEVVPGSVESDEMALSSEVSEYTSSGAENWMFSFARKRMGSAVEQRVPKILNNTTGKVRTESAVELTCNEKQYDSALDLLGDVFTLVFDQAKGLMD